jgi:5-methylcytosine-specific restriction endonuclease McrBC regulatory subunit McrC
MRGTLFEYDKWVKVENTSILFHSLKTIWRQRNFTDLTEELEENGTDKNYQPFLRFSNNEIRANNYVGFIQTANDLIEISQLSRERQKRYAEPYLFLVQLLSQMEIPF